MGNDLVHRMPWEPEPAPERTLDEKVMLLQSDMAYAIAHTAIIVHSNRPELAFQVNTKRGQIVPAGRCTFKDGSYVEFQDIGMCQPGLPLNSVANLVARVYEVARELGLEL